MPSIMYNPRSRKEVPAPAGENERAALRTQGFYLAEAMVDTRDGYFHIIPAEEQVSDGQGAMRLLSLRRDDGEPMWMTRADWHKLPQDRREALIVKKAQAPKPEAPKAAAAPADDLATLKAQVEMLTRALAAQQTQAQAPAGPVPQGGKR